MHLSFSSPSFLLLNPPPEKKIIRLAEERFFRIVFFFEKSQRTFSVFVACKRRAVLCRWFRNKHRLCVREIERGREGGESERVVCESCVCACSTTRENACTHIHTFRTHACTDARVHTQLAWAIIYAIEGVKRFAVGPIQYLLRELLLNAQKNKTQNISQNRTTTKTLSYK